MSDQIAIGKTNDGRVVVTTGYGAGGSAGPSYLTSAQAREAGQRILEIANELDAEAQIADLSDKLDVPPEVLVRGQYREDAPPIDDDLPTAPATPVSMRR